MKKNHQLFSFKKIFASLVLCAIAASCTKSDMSSISSSSSSNDESKSFEGYDQVNLVANNSSFGARKVDPRLQNAWGLSASDGGIIWLSANETGLSFVYDSTGAHFLPPVAIPSHTAKRGNPTGNIFNATTDFIIPGTAAPARFIFADEGGTISAWNGSNLTAAVKVADKAKSGAVYKGLAMGRNDGNNFLYVTNFSKAKIDVFDKDFKPVTGMSFKDPNLPKGYAPFNIRNIGGMLFVTYALQTAEKEDDSAGVGHGFVDVFKTNGEMAMRFASRGKLNSPWGIAKGRRGFLNDDGGGDDILIGNFGDGRINVFDHNGKFLGQLMNDGHPIAIDGLWAIDNNIHGISSKQLYFTAGPNGEEDGLFGYLVKK
jgi:uncharacterized protein (TIGR03118 family)